MTITSAQAVTLLEYVLFESPALAQADAANWTDDGAIAQAATAMSISPEGGIADQVVRLYQGALGRLPSGEEISFYVKVAEAGLDAADIARGPNAVPGMVWSRISEYFTHSAEFTAAVAAHGGSLIDMLYANVLGRVPSAAESAFYQAQLAGGADAGLLLQYFVNSPEYQGKVEASIQQTLAGYGVLLAPTGGPTATSPVNDGLASVYTAGPAGATYATAPTAVLDHHGSVEIIFSDSAALTLDPQVALGSAIIDLPGLLAKLETGLAAHHVAWGVYEGNTYLAESLTGTPGPADTSVVEVVGTYAHLQQVPAAGHIVFLS